MDGDDQSLDDYCMMYPAQGIPNPEKLMLRSRLSWDIGMQMPQWPGTRNVTVTTMCTTGFHVLSLSSIVGRGKSAKWRIFHCHVSLPEGSMFRNMLVHCWQPVTGSGASLQFGVNDLLREISSIFVWSHFDSKRNCAFWYLILSPLWLVEVREIVGYTPICMAVPRHFLVTPHDSMLMVLYKLVSPSFKLLCKAINYRIYHNHIITYYNIYIYIHTINHT